MKQYKQYFATLLLAIFTLSLAGCGALHTSVKKRNLDVQTKMSSTVWLDPVSADKRTVFLQLRNTSDKPGLTYENEVRNAIAAKGYQVIDDPEAAHYWLQVNVLQVGRTDLRSGDSFGTFGSAVAGAAAGAQFGDGTGQIAAGVAGAGLGVIFDAMVDDNLFTMITDIQISEKAKDGVRVNQSEKAVLKQGESGSKTQTSSEVVDRKKYQTRIVSLANKANLKFEEAEPALRQGLITSLSGML
ncbi:MULTISPECIES: complement resistance protein TraT [unclassified Thalassotalea]|uniref:complement resistance protein TraT n=1 Tax=unclassified Thalassotalea TaxID=2614972 RepID=UPI001080F9D8|nr:MULTISPECIES: complement resistance protein TraT [unclassified Thalassotalea]NMP15705.1 complement resistance protein TraT [Thalassotalea sp. Y01]QBY04762.1 complement resistance protein TraT [Thalassotalea sp. HSM 43]